MSERSRRKRGDVYAQNNNGQKDEEYWISCVLRCLIQNKNRMELEKLQKKVEDEHKKKYPDFEKIINRYSNLFRIEEGDQTKEDDEEDGVLVDSIVSGRTEVRLCEKHCSKAGSCKSVECKSLHMCRFYILNECNFQPCLFGHDIRNDHNVYILQMHLLHALGPQDVGYLLRDVRNRNETTMPTICSFYNVKMGCSREDCQFLHLCKKFVEEDCKFGMGCKRSHNLFDKQPVQVFKRYGIAENDVEKVMDLIRKTLDKSTPAKSATEMKQTCYITSKSVKYPSSQGPCNRYFVNEKKLALEENKNLIRSSCIDAPTRITKEVIYIPSRPQSDNSYRIDEENSNTYHREDSRHVVIDEGYQHKLKYCYRELVPPDRKSQECETHQTHTKEGTRFEDVSSDEDYEPLDKEVPTFGIQERVNLETSNVCSPKETQKNECDRKVESARLVQIIDIPITKKPSCAKSQTVSTEYMELRYETMDCPGSKTKLKSHSLSFLENKRNQIQIKSKPSKRVFQPTTDKNDEGKIESAEILNYIIDLIDTEGTLAAKEEVKNEISQDDTANKGSGYKFQEPASVHVFKITESNNIEHDPVTEREYNQASMDNSSENSEKADATNLVLHDHSHKSEGAKEKDSAYEYAFHSSQDMQYTLSEDSMYKMKSVRDDRPENVKETCSSILTKGDKECDSQLGAEEFKVKRVTVNNGQPQWMFCSVDTLTSLNMDSETQEKLENSYQLFQQSRQCFFEAAGSRLHVDFMTMCGKILNNDIEQQGQ
ncbi:hypothetical protein CHS0354_002190 [Potamilus streckersoni]|uniref:C3H1-type domain-containing protein n=1 Tax=Potamilus streckersoni TaxID=2493646 RepID=A0AAE0RS48_9BIVA|nr:hypothetical protein CHS0354_002190 [Potamilus streckersoni]